MVKQQPSRRWTHFHSAIQLAVQRSTHKWTFEDFAECFPLYYEEQKDGALAVCNEISRYMESQLTEYLEEIFTKYEARAKIDILHDVVGEAAARKAAGGMEGSDVWREDIPPRSAVCARTVPLLEAQNAELRRELAALEQENERLQSRLVEDVHAIDEADAQATGLLDKVDQLYQEWLKLPMDEIGTWTIQTAESTKPIMRS